MTDQQFVLLLFLHSIYCSIVSEGLKERRMDEVDDFPFYQ
jgi:hypothetical protein